MTSRVRTPSRVRIETADAPWKRLAEAAIVHVGQSAVVLDPPGFHRIVVSGPRLGLVPWGVCIPDPSEFEAFRAGLTAGGGFALRSASVERVDLRMRRASVNPAAVEYLASRLGEPSPASGPMDTSAIRAAGTDLAAAYLAADSAAIDRMLARLIGAGPGSTPTGDDVIVGVLAGLNAAGSAPATTASLLTSLDRTTSTSRPYLAAAADGRFSERVHDLVAGLATVDGARTALVAAHGWGATSGLDLAAGLLAGILTARSHRHERIA